MERGRSVRRKGGGKSPSSKERGGADNQLKSGEGDIRIRVTISGKRASSLNGGEEERKGKGR